MFEDRAEFVSEKWVGLARGYLQRRVDAADDRIDGARFSLCEVIENAPGGFKRPGGVAAWHARLEGRQLTVGLGEIEGADLTARGDYHAVLQAARVFNADEPACRRGLREAQHRNGGRPVATRRGSARAARLHTSSPACTTSWPPAPSRTRISTTASAGSASLTPPASWTRPATSFSNAP
jgi:hypothetical protein